MSVRFFQHFSTLYRVDRDREEKEKRETKSPREKTGRAEHRYLWLSMSVWYIGYWIIK
jgi:hypothetical protein